MRKQTLFMAMMAVTLSIGLSACGNDENEEIVPQKIKKALIGVWEVDKDVWKAGGNRWAFAEDGNGQLFDGEGFRNFTYLFDENTKTISIHGLNDWYNEIGSMMILTDINSKSITWQNVSMDYTVQKLTKIKVPNQTEEDFLKLLIGTWKTVEPENDYYYYFTIEKNGKLTVTRVFNDNYKNRSDSEGSLQYGEMVNVGLFRVHYDEYIIPIVYVIKEVSEKKITILHKWYDWKTWILNKVEGVSPQL